MNVELIKQFIKFNPYCNFDKGLFCWGFATRPYSYISIGVPPNQLKPSEILLLNLDAWVYSLKIKMATELNRKKPSIRDYPPCAVACCDDNGVNVISLNYAGHGGESIEFSQTMLAMFKNKLAGKPGLQSPITVCKNRIGNCAEQRAANDLNCDVKNIRFSRAFRPRTMTIVSYCENCKTLFPQL